MTAPSSKATTERDFSSWPFKRVRRLPRPRPHEQNLACLLCVHYGAIRLKSGLAPIPNSGCLDIRAIVRSVPCVAVWREPALGTGRFI